MTQGAVQVLGARPVVDVELDEAVVVLSQRRDVIEPRVHVACLGLGLERWAGLIPARHAAASEVPHAQLGRQALHARVRALVEDPAVVRIAHGRQRAQLPLDDLERLVRGDAQRDHRHAHAFGRRRGVGGAAHPADVEPEERGQPGAQIPERDRRGDVQGERAPVGVLQPEAPETHEDENPQRGERDIAEPLRARQRGRRSTGDDLVHCKALSLAFQPWLGGGMPLERAFSRQAGPFGRHVLFSVGPRGSG